MEKGEWYRLGERVVVGAGLIAVVIYLLGMRWEGEAWRWLNLAVCAIFIALAFHIIVDGVVKLMDGGAFIRLVGGAGVLVGWLWFMGAGVSSAYIKNPL